jgi:hypothetical protein
MPALGVCLSVEMLLKPRRQIVQYLGSQCDLVALRQDNQPINYEIEGSIAPGATLGVCLSVGMLLKPPRPVYSKSRIMM